MARIFFSVEWIKKVVQTPKGTIWHDDSSTGYGNVRKMLTQWAESRGHELSSSPNDCNVEIYVGDAGVKPSPHFSPSIIVTMFEQTRFPQSWEEPLGNWDLIAVPSNWCKKCFSEQLKAAGYAKAAKNVRRIRLGIHPQNFPFIERPKTRDRWTIISQGVELRDRKGLTHVFNVFKSKKLPSDIHILLKHLPLADQSIIADGYDQELGKLRICGKLLGYSEFQDLLETADFSVNPTGGEGFGLIPLEHLSTGLGVAVTRFSGVTDYFDPRYFRPIKHRLKAGVIPFARAALPIEASIYNNIIWSYEHQDEVREIGRRGSAWVKENWTQEGLKNSLDELLDEALKIPRKDNPNRRECSWEIDPGLTLREGKVPLFAR